MDFEQTKNNTYHEKNSIAYQKIKKKYEKHINEMTYISDEMKP